MTHKPCYVEEVKTWNQTRWGKVPLISTARDATEEEIAACEKQHSEGECRHGVFYDEGGWMYDERKCAVCDAFLALI